MPSNPKFPMLTGTKMRLLWDMIRLENGRLRAVREQMSESKQRMAQFRNQWGVHRPRNDEDWLAFWYGYRLLEDSLDAALAEITGTVDDIDTTSLSATEIIRSHGVEGLDADPLGSIRVLINRLEELNGVST